MLAAGHLIDKQVAHKAVGVLLMGGGQLTSPCKILRPGFTLQGEQGRHRFGKAVRPEFAAG